MNPAARLHRIYDKLVAQSDDYQLVQTWTNVFDIDKRSPHHEDEVAACVMALRSEIALTRKRLGKVCITPC